MTTKYDPVLHMRVAPDATTSKPIHSGQFCGREIHFVSRHPSTSHLLRYFDYEHLPSSLQKVSRQVHQVAFQMANTLPEGPELTAGLRKLLEARDCFERCAHETRGS